MASLQQRYGKGSEWYVVYRDASGKQRWIKGYTDKGQTRNLANRLENEKTAILNGDIDPQNEVKKVERGKSIEQHLQQYKETLQARGSSSNHVSYTVADIQRLIDFGKITTASAITRNLVDRWVLTLTKDSMRTINRRVGSVQAFLRHLQQQGGVSEYLLQGYKKRKTAGTEKRKRRALEKAEVEKLLTCKEVADDRRFIYEFAVKTGLRYSEVVSMRPESFNWQHSTVTVSANDAKNKSKSQTIPLHKSLVPALKKLCDGKARDEAIFTLPARTDAARILRADCTLAKVDTQRVDFHALRHTFITRLAESNVHPKILQGLARHSTIDTTLRYYTHFKQVDEHTAINSL